MKLLLECQQALFRLLAGGIDERDKYGCFLTLKKLEDYLDKEQEEFTRLTKEGDWDEDQHRTMGETIR